MFVCLGLDGTQQPSIPYTTKVHHRAEHIHRQDIILRTFGIDNSSPYE